MSKTVTLHCHGLHVWYAREIEEDCGLVVVPDYCPKCGEAHVDDKLLELDGANKIPFDQVAEYLTLAEVVKACKDSKEAACYFSEAARFILEQKVEKAMEGIER